LKYKLLKLLKDKHLK